MEADVSWMQVKKKKVWKAKKVHSSQFLTGMCFQDSLVDWRRVLRRMRGLVMDMWEDYAPAAFSVN